jgi:predicted ATPase/DNA-binding CsgD family transcriptional regulator
MARSATSLPVPVDSFVGRDAELADGLGLITESRLLSLVGPGGAGKTRLVLRLADRVLERCGVPGKRCWLVDLSAAESGGDAPAQLVAAAVGASIATAADPVAAVAEQVGDEPALLVVDNCEQVAGAVARLVRPLLEACQGLRVLATSQQPLGVHGEVVFPVEGLPVPGPEEPGWQTAAAVQLFADRAREVDHRFVVVPELAEICGRLDGLPLSIELAARWVRVLSPTEILAELASDRFALLEAAGGQDRHGSLWGVIERSYRLLDATEQAMVRRLSALRGPFDVDTAMAAVTGDGELSRVRVLRLLADLVGRSLLTPVRAGSPTADTGERRSRFRMLESVRAFGLAQLAAAGEEKACQARLVRWYSDLCAPMADPDNFYYPSALLWRLDDDRDNLAAALEWARLAGDEDAQRLLGVALGIVWDHLGWYERFAALIRSLPEAPDGDARQRCMLLYAQATAEGDLLHRDAVNRLASELEAVAAAAGLPMYQVRALHRQVHLYYLESEYAAGMEACEKAIAVADAADRPEVVAENATNLAWFALELGDFERGIEVLDQALPVLRARADPTSLANALHNRAALAFMAGDLDTADQQFRESLAIGGREPHYYKIALLGLVVVADARHQPIPGLRLAAAADRAPALVQDETKGYWNERIRAAVASCRQALPAHEREHAWTEGGRLTREEVIAYTQHDSWPERFTAPAPGSPAPRDVPLSQRELEIARLVADGLTNRQIAAGLTLSVRTIDTHLEHIRTKLGVQSRVQIGTWLAQRTP